MISIIAQFINQVHFNLCNSDITSLAFDANLDVKYVILQVNFKNLLQNLEALLLDSYRHKFPLHVAKAIQLSGQLVVT